MGVEGDHRFAAQIILLQEGVEDHGHIAPPVRIAQENHVIVRHAADCFLDRGPEVLALFLPSLGNKGGVIRGIGILRLDAVDVRVCFPPDDLGHILRVAQDFTVDDHCAVGFFCGHIVGICGFRHGEVGHQSLFRCLCGLGGLGGRGGLGQIQAVDPALYLGGGSPFREAAAIQPIAVSGKLLQQFAALAQAGAGGGAEGDHGFTGEVIVFYKVIDRPGGHAPPDRITNIAKGLHMCYTSK